MKAYYIKYNNLNFFVSDDLKFIGKNDVGDIASTWSTKDGNYWYCSKKNNANKVSQLLEAKHEYIPTKIILFLTSNCNLNCSYCYSKMYPIDYTISSSDCKSVIDKMVTNLIRLNRKTLKIKFHGGGEPFVAFKLMKQVVDYAQLKSKEESLKLRIEASTNGVLTSTQKNWIVENVNRLNISFDGTVALHRQNRPAKNSNIDSFKELKKTVDFFDTISYPFTLRTTITDSDRKNIQSIAYESKVLSEKANKKLELVCENNDGISNELQLGKSIEFLSYIEEYYFAKEKIDEKIASFDACDGGYGQCGAWGDNLILDGLKNISTCFKYSALGQNSPFFICSLNEFLSKPIFLNDESEIVQVTKNAEETCAFCFLWKKCGGGCIALNNNEHSNKNCNLLRSFFMKRIINEK